MDKEKREVSQLRPAKFYFALVLLSEAIMEVTPTTVSAPPAVGSSSAPAVASPAPVAAAPISIKDWFVVFDDNGFSLKGHRVDNNSEVFGNFSSPSRKKITDFWEGPNWCSGAWQRSER